MIKESLQMKINQDESTAEEQEAKALITLLKLSEESLNDERLTLDEAFDIS